MPSSGPRVPESDSFFPYAEAKAAADAYLRGTGLEWTILGPGRLTMEAPSGRIGVGPGKDAVGRDTARGNVALVIAAVLAEPRTAGKVIDFIDGDTPIEEAIRRIL